MHKRGKPFNLELNSWNIDGILIIPGRIFIDLIGFPLKTSSTRYASCQYTVYHKKDVILGVASIPCFSAGILTSFENKGNWPL